VPAFNSLLRLERDLGREYHPWRHLLQLVLKLLHESLLGAELRLHPPKLDYIRLKVEPVRCGLCRQRSSTDWKESLHRPTKRVLLRSVPRYTYATNDGKFL